MTTTQIERVIPLREAASRKGISVAALTRLVSDGTIRAVQLPDGSMAVSEQEIHEIASQSSALELRGHPVSVRAASEKYEVPGTTIREWIKREYIAVIKPSFAMELDEADVAECVVVYRKHKERGTRAPLFDDSGRPYELRYPDVAQYRRKRKQASVTDRQPSGRVMQIAKSR